MESTCSGAMGLWRDMSIGSRVLNGRCMGGPALSCCGRK